MRTCHNSTFIWVRWSALMARRLITSKKHPSPWRLKSLLLVVSEPFDVKQIKLIMHLAIDLLPNLRNLEYRGPPFDVILDSFKYRSSSSHLKVLELNIQDSTTNSSELLEFLEHFGSFKEPRGIWLYHQWHRLFTEFDSSLVDSAEIVCWYYSIFPAYSQSLWCLLIHICLVCLII